MLDDDLDLIVFLGDYIYESSTNQPRVRRHGTPEAVTLDDYRMRYALYKTDPDLKAAHAACPWIATWDDHEVSNDWFRSARTRGSTIVSHSESSSSFICSTIASIARQPGGDRW